MTLINRDPFARIELHRRQVKVTTEVCKECGQAKPRRHKGKPDSNVLYEFWGESDGGRSWSIAGLFCSTSCMRAYTT